ncbi:MAG: GNAT family N-acetyltransferase [Eggerthellaceae bacterium]
MKIDVRRASLADVDKLMEWRMEVLHEVFEIPPDEAMRDMHTANLAYYRQEIPRGNHVAVFAESGRETVGCGGVCLYREMPSPENPTGQCAYLMNIYTRKAYRGQGVGRNIVRWLVDYAEQRGIAKTYLETTASGRPLYESMGFKDMQDYLRLG